MCVTSILKPIIGHHFDQKMARTTISINNGKFNCLSNNRKFSCTGKTIYGQKNFLCLDCHQIRCNAHCTCRLHVVLRNGLFIQKVICHYPFPALAATKQDTGEKAGKEAAVWCQAATRGKISLGSPSSFALPCIWSSASVREEFRATDDHQRLDATGKYRIKFKAA